MDVTGIQQQQHTHTHTHRSKLHPDRTGLASLPSYILLFSDYCGELLCLLFGRQGHRFNGNKRDSVFPCSFLGLTGFYAACSRSSTGRNTHQQLFGWLLIWTLLPPTPSGFLARAALFASGSRGGQLWVEVWSSMMMYVACLMVVQRVIMVKFAAKLHRCHYPPGDLFSLDNKVVVRRPEIAVAVGPQVIHTHTHTQSKNIFNADALP